MKKTKKMAKTTSKIRKRRRHEKKEIKRTDWIFLFSVWIKARAPFSI